jgi:MFS family permease
MGILLCRLRGLGTLHLLNETPLRLTNDIQTWDAFDFFSVSLSVTSLSKTFDKSKTDITWGITLVLMFRSVGSIAFGIASDRYGRKWPFVVNNLLFIVLELVSAALQTPLSQWAWQDRCQEIYEICPNSR